MVVRDYEGMGTGDNRRSEHLPRMDDNGVESPYPHQMVPRYPLPGIEVDCDKAFHVGIEVGVTDDVFAPIAGDGSWIVAEGAIWAEWAVAERDDLPFFWNPRLRLLPRSQRNSSCSMSVVLREKDGRYRPVRLRDYPELPARHCVVCREESGADFEGSLVCILILFLKSSPIATLVTAEAFEDCRCWDVFEGVWRRDDSTKRKLGCAHSR